MDDNIFELVKNILNKKTAKEEAEVKIKNYIEKILSQYAEISIDVNKGILTVKHHDNNYNIFLQYDSHMEEYFIIVKLEYPIFHCESNKITTICDIFELEIDCDDKKIILAKNKQGFLEYHSLEESIYEIADILINNKKIR